MKTTIKAQLVAVQKDIYTNYVFKNLDEIENSEERYKTVTKCPNWQGSNNMLIGDVGYLTYEFAEAGTSYFDISSNETRQYNYTANYFMNFIKETKDLEKEYNF